MAQSMGSEFIRIYQGRITGLTVRGEVNRVLSKEEMEEVLWRHVVLYQDAVNYYLVALAAMSHDENSFIGKLKLRMRDVWNDFQASGGKRPGLKHSLARVFPQHRERLLDETHGLEAACNLILAGNPSSSELLEKAICQVADKCIVNGDVKQSGATYIARLCRPDYDGNWECDEKANEGAAGRQRLFAALRESDALAAIRALQPDISLEWFGVKTQTGKFFEGDDAKKELKDAIRFYLDRDKRISPPAALDWLAQESVQTELARMLDKVDELEQVRFPRNNRTSLPIRNMAWMLKFFPNDATVSLAKLLLKPEKEDKKAQVIDAGIGGDPVREARGTRGFVFPYFTALVCQETENKFDKEAFSEALKTINQFRQKTAERDEELKRYQAAKDWMEGVSELKKPPRLDEGDDAEEADEETGALPILAGDPRWERLNELLKTELAVTNPFTDGQSADYGLTWRTIRTADEIFKGWNALLAKRQGQSDDQMQQALLEHLKAVQTKRSDVFGSAMLFGALSAPQNWCIWRADSAPAGKFRSGNILRDAVVYAEVLDEIKHLMEPIRFTPADAEHSRRQLDLKPFIRKKTGHTKPGHYVVPLTYRNSDGSCVFQECLLEYSAPRLRRDGLLADGESVYLPPAARPLLECAETAADAVDFKEVDVQLMPDVDRSGHRRFLLNFLPSLNVAKLSSSTQSPFLAKGQLYYANDANVCMLWPSYGATADGASWYKSGKPFDLVSVDLGQRTAGALSRITVTTTPRPGALSIGHAENREWYAVRRHSQLLRLPGEDAKVLEKDRFVQERDGERGRHASKEETLAGQALMRKLLAQDEAEFRRIWGETQDMECLDRNYFPEQNDLLLVGFRRALSRLRQLMRFLMGRTLGNLKGVEEEIAACSWLTDKTNEGIRAQVETLRRELPDDLLTIANRILPLRGRGWQWCRVGDGRCLQLRQTARGSDPTPTLIRGQRGLSFLRLEQLETFRQCCQSLNRILMTVPGERPMSVQQMRETPIPDPCPDVLMRLDELKEQRVNQTANLILTQALGLRHRPHRQEDRQRRAENDIHGEYAQIPGLQPAAFVVIENLSRYRFSQDRSRRENSRLMKWAHRAIRDKLKLLCEIYGIPLVEVNAAYSSKFSAEGIPGFRAEELTYQRLIASYGFRQAIGQTLAKRHMAGKNAQPQEPPHGQQLQLFDVPEEKPQQASDTGASALARVASQNARIAKLLEWKQPASSVVIPRNGGPVFVCFCQSDRLVQADVNASFNLGLRAVVEGSRLDINNRLSMERKGKVPGCWQVKKTSKLAKMVYQEPLEVDYVPSGSYARDGGNVFVLGCRTEELHFYQEQQKPIFKDEATRRKYPNLLFGGGLWHDSLLQWKRCRQLNWQRLRKLMPELPEATHWREDDWETAVRCFLTDEASQSCQWQPQEWQKLRGRISVTKTLWSDSPTDQLGY